MMLVSRAPHAAVAVRRSSRAGHRAAVCRGPAARIRCSIKAPHQHDEEREAHQQQPQQQQQPRRSSWLAGSAAAVAGLLVPLLPSWAFDIDTFGDGFFSDTIGDSFSASAASAADASGIDTLADSPPLLDTLLVVFIAYFTVVLLALWFSSFLEATDDADASSSQQPPPGSDQSEAPPGYGSFLNANVRSVVTPSAKVMPLQDLGQVVHPLEGEDLAHLKARLAAGAAEALELQLSNCERLVRTKLLARKLGYQPSRQQRQQAAAADGSSSSRHAADQQIEEMMLAAVLTAPEGLGSWQHRAAVEALIDQQLDDLLPPGGGAYSEELILRQVMRRVVHHLVMEESLLLLEGTGKAAQMMQEASGGKGGKGGQRGRNPWALW